ncbi:MAG: YihY/virulence factor BrkB family protein [Candidatus Altiarchaeota archaeon]
MTKVTDIGGLKRILLYTQRIGKRFPRLTSTISFVVSVSERFIHHSGSTLAAAISYYTFLSLFPILILIVSLLGYVTADSGIFYSSIIDSVDQVMPGYVSLVERNLGTLGRNAGRLGFVAFITLLWVSTGLFSSIEFSLNTIFEVKEYKSLLQHGLISIGSVFFLSCFIMASTLITPVKGLTIYYLSILPILDKEQASFLVGFIMTFLPFIFSYFLFFTIYRFIPDRKLGEKEIALGAALAAISWELSKNILVGYLSARMAYYELVYGSLVLIVVSILWSYIFSLILVLTGCIIIELHERRESKSAIDPAL